MSQLPQEPHTEPLSVHAIHAEAYGVLDAAGVQVGVLKWIRGVWKFKALGHDPSGQIVPGGGPLTDLHNTLFASLDRAEIQAVLGRGHNAGAP